MGSKNCRVRNVGGGEIYNLKLSRKNSSKKLIRPKAQNFVEKYSSKAKPKDYLNLQELKIYFFYI